MYVGTVAEMKRSKFLITIDLQLHFIYPRRTNSTDIGEDRCVSPSHTVRIVFLIQMYETGGSL